MAADPELEQWKQQGNLWAIGLGVSFVLGMFWIVAPLAWWQGGILRRRIQARGLPPVTQVELAWLGGMILTILTLLTALLTFLAFLFLFGGLAAFLAFMSVVG
jgi:hypothetical protein